MSRKLWLAGLVILAACASAPPAPAPPTGKVLAYAVPTPASAAYAFVDSSEFNIQGGAAMGEVKATIAANGVVSVTLAQKPGGLEATMRITRLAGAMTNSAMGGGPTVNETGVQGAAVLNVTPQGGATITAMPTVSREVQQVGISEGFFRRFFARLPGGSVQVGTTWVDTVTTTDDNAGTKVTMRDIVTSTLVGDTVVNGRTLAHISTAIQRALDVSGTNQGVEIAQKLTGKATGFILWDVAARLLVQRVEQTELSGTFDLPQMGIAGLPVTASSRARISLQ